MCCDVGAERAHLLMHVDVGVAGVTVDLDWAVRCTACHVRLDNCGMLCS